MRDNVALKLFNFIFQKEPLSRRAVKYSNAVTELLVIKMATRERERELN